jgi:hypothetical protein
VIGTAEERRAKRREQIRQRNAINSRLQFMSGLQPGTLAAFNLMRKQNKLSADVLLYKLVRLGHKIGI